MSHKGTQSTRMLRLLRKAIRYRPNGRMAQSPLLVGQLSDEQLLEVHRMYEAGTEIEEIVRTIKHGWGFFSEKHDYQLRRAVKGFADRVDAMMEHQRPQTESEETNSTKLALSQSDGSSVDVRKELRALIEIQKGVVSELQAEDEQLAVVSTRTMRQRHLLYDMVKRYARLEARENTDSDRDDEFDPNLCGLREERIVSVQEFVEGEDYLKFPVWPRIMEALIQLFEEGDYVEIVAGGAIGSGKTTFANLAMAYMLYRLSCYHNPQGELGLAPDSPIVFIHQSASFRQARQVGFDQFKSLVRRSAYFREKFPFDPKIRSELRFPHNITVQPLSSIDTAALGMNVYAAILDEIAFLDNARQSRQGNPENPRPQAERLYLALQRRMASRFKSLGRLSGKLFLVSSPHYPGDFISRKIEESRTDASIFVIKVPIWEATGRETYSGETFLVEVGTEQRHSRIIENEAEAMNPENIIEVPVEYRTEFERDIDTALRDLAAIVTSVESPFIRSRELISKACEKHRELFHGQQLFGEHIVDLSRYENRDLYGLINWKYLERYVHGWKTRGFTRAPVFALHLDMALRQDNVGIALGRVIELRDNPLGLSADSGGECESFRKIHKNPVIVIDGVMAVTPPSHGDISLVKVMRLVFTLVKYGRIHLRYITMDSYQSVLVLNKLKKIRTVKTAKELSVDKTLDPYLSLKSAITEERLLLPDRPLLVQELEGLAIDRQRDRIDHRPGSSKDLADCCAGVVHILTRSRYTYAESIEGDELPGYAFRRGRFRPLGRRRRRLSLREQRWQRWRAELGVAD